jgi:hypothetical protein
MVSRYFVQAFDVLQKLAIFGEDKPKPSFRDLVRSHIPKPPGKETVEPEPAPKPSFRDLVRSHIPKETPKEIVEQPKVQIEQEQKQPEPSIFEDEPQPEPKKPVSFRDLVRSHIPKKEPEPSIFDDDIEKPKQLPPAEPAEPKDEDVPYHLRKVYPSDPFFKAKTTKLTVLEQMALIFCDVATYANKIRGLSWIPNHEQVLDSLRRKGLVEAKGSPKATEDGRQRSMIITSKGRDRHQIYKDLLAIGKKWEDQKKKGLVNPNELPLDPARLQ